MWLSQLFLFFLFLFWDPLSKLDVSIRSIHTLVVAFFSLCLINYSNLNLFKCRHMAFNFTFSLVCILKCMQHLLNVLFNLAAVNFHQCPHFSHPLWPICLVHSPPPAPVEVRFLVCLQAPSLEGKNRKLNSQEASVLPSPTPAVAPESITQTSHGPLS